MMKWSVIVSLCALFTLTQQATSVDRCMCELIHSETVFPHEKLNMVNNSASQCNSNINRQATLDLDMLLLGLEKRLPQLQKDVSLLEMEDDEDIYAVVSLYLIENELRAVNQLISKLNMTTLTHRDLTKDTTKQLEDMKVEMRALEAYDTTQVVRKKRENGRLMKELNQCKNGHHSIAKPIQPPPGNCPHGKFLNITGPRVNTQGEYPGSYHYGAWGRDPKPEAGKEKWYWLVMLTSGNKYSNYVRLYSSLSSLIVGVSAPGNVQIDSSNPNTNTIQGPNAVLYGGALYYNCYNRPAVCRFNLTAKTVTTVQLPEGTRYNSKGNFCHLDTCYLFTDLDLATDESGVWVVYTTVHDFGNLVLSKVEEGEPLRLGQTWHTSVYKTAVTNTFMACGVLYATRYVSDDVEEIFYSFDTTTGEEKFNVGVFINKISPNILALNYSPVDQMLHAYCDSYMVSYKVLFSGRALKPQVQPPTFLDLGSGFADDTEDTLFELEEPWDDVVEW